MQVAVVGGGVVGVSTAFFLAAAGHEAVVLERGSNVAEEASFGNSGLVAPASAAPWALPGMPRRLLGTLLHRESPVLLRRRLDPTLWRWVKRWMSECELDRLCQNKERLHRLGSYSRALLEQLRLHYHLDYEQTGGHLRLFRTASELAQAQPLLDLLQQAEVPHHLLDPDAARAIEPALTTTALAQALHLPGDEAGNCALFTKQMKTIAQSIGVQFHFGAEVQRVEALDNRVALHVGEHHFTADAVVLAAGTNNPLLMGASATRIPFHTMQTYAATCSIRDFDEAPLASLTDDAFKCTITRFGNRVRVSGVVAPSPRDTTVPELAQRTLHRVGSDWFPNATNYSNATLWSGARLALPDGVPLVGPTTVRRVFVGLDDGSNGWTAALGMAKILSDMVGARTPDIDVNGLTLSRYG
ncbi:MAG: FAD-dependent oxidoreductase [Pseudomonadota bacterium]|nr:FAD-dependent oxidoreductase [Pseudomonadota bacterium]